jgi:hypothetical protein
MIIPARSFATCSGLTTALLAGLLLTGCATHKANPTTRTTRTTTVRDVTPATRSDTRREATPSTAPTTSEAARRSTDTSTANLPDRTGIPACDDYLASYIGCHRAAEIFAPGQLQDRYEAMRTSLLRDSQNPDIRPQLAARCNSLATQLRTALHGKSCEVSPAPASTTP